MGDHTKLRIKIHQTHRQKIPIIKNPNKYINEKNLTTTIDILFLKI